MQGVLGTYPGIELVDGGVTVDDLTVIPKEVVEEMAAVEEMVAVEEMAAAGVEDGVTPLKKSLRPLVAVEEGMMAGGVEGGLVLVPLEKYLHPLAWRKLATTCKRLLKTNY